MTDPHPAPEQDEREARRQQLLRRIPDYDTRDIDPFADDWKEAS